MIVSLSVSGYCERIHLINFLRLFLENLPLEKEKLLEDKISKIIEYISLLIWVGIKVLKFEPILI